VTGARDRKRADRQKRKRRSTERSSTPVEAAAPQPTPPEADGNGRQVANETFQQKMARRYEERNAEARAKLEPLDPGERPTAVTVGAIVAVLLAVANVVAVVLGWDQGVDEDDRARALAYTILATGVLLVVAWGMWRAKYWAVLGMQTLLALTLIGSSLALVTVSSAGGAIVLVAILAAAGTLFWFMVKAMARIQMPERPTRAR
jgi:hypothetical protein